MDFFSRLNLNESSTPEDVERMYKQLSRIYHPDKAASNSEIFLEFKVKCFETVI